MGEHVGMQEEIDSDGNLSVLNVRLCYLLGVLFPIFNFQDVLNMQYVRTTLHCSLPLADRAFFMPELPDIRSSTAESGKGEYAIFMFIDV